MLATCYVSYGSLRGITNLVLLCVNAHLFCQINVLLLLRHPECREVATSTSEEHNVDSKQFHDTCTGNWRYVFTKAI